METEQAQRLAWFERHEETRGIKPFHAHPLAQRLQRPAALLRVPVERGVVDAQHRRIDSVRAIPRVGFVEVEDLDILAPLRGDATRIRPEGGDIRRLAALPRHHQQLAHLAHRVRSGDRGGLRPVSVRPERHSWMTSEHPIHQGGRDPASPKTGRHDEFDDLPIVGIGGLGVSGKTAVIKREYMGDAGSRTLQREHGLLAQRRDAVARLGLGSDAPHLANP